MTDIANEYYNITIFDMMNGTTIDEIELILKDYEEKEEYEICRGIYAALEMVKYNIDFRLYDKKNLNKIIYEHD